MPLETLLTANAVICGLRATSKKQLLQELAAHASALCSIDEHVIFDALLERERLGATCVGDGVAIPHARLPDLDTVHGIFARLKTPIDFDAADEEPVDLVFLLLAPDSANAEHLKALARISRLMKQESMRRNLRGADSAEAIYSMLVETQKRAA